MLPIPELASAAVANFAPYLALTAPPGLGSRKARQVAGCFDRLKRRLGAEAALAHFEARPADPASRAELRQLLSSRLAADPGFRVELDDLVEEICPWA